MNLLGIDDVRAEYLTILLKNWHVDLMVVPEEEKIKELPKKYFRNQEKLNQI